ncbi:MAG TPA: hypothetical protein VNK70_01150 [Candidatus Paceibacterota bacterium]|nr:hypothetical protein [Candidatus Paceibacterota bacterium]
MKSKKTLTIIVALAILAVVFGLGSYAGKSIGRKEMKKELSPLLSYIFPEPPAEIKSLGGKITGIYGATINLEVPDPDDYLPHTDGSPRKTETRFVTVNANTEIKLVNYGKIDGRGAPETRTLKLTDLKVGDAITVESAENIKEAEKFDATKIFLIKYL